MKTILATVAALALTAGLATAQQAVLGFGAFGNSAALSAGGTASQSIAAPGAGLTFGFANNTGTASGASAAIATLGGVITLSNGTNTSNSTTAGGSLGTAASVGLAAGNSLGLGVASGFGGIGLSLP